MPARPQLLLPADASESQMRQMLMKVLPDVIQQSPGTTPVHYRAVSDLVDAIIFAARECGDDPALRDIAFQLLTKRPTAHQCNKLGESIRELVDVRFADMKNRPMSSRTHAFKVWAGRLWVDVVEAFGGNVSVDAPGRPGGGIRG